MGFSVFAKFHGITVKFFHETLLTKIQFTINSKHRYGQDRQNRQHRPAQAEIQRLKPKVETKIYSDSSLIHNPPGTHRGYFVC